MRVRGKPVSCCFTGHRPAKLPWGTDEGDERCLRLKARLREVIARAVEDGYTHFICGMAEGCDLYCEMCIRDREYCFRFSSYSSSVYRLSAYSLRSSTIE